MKRKEGPGVAALILFRTDMIEPFVIGKIAG
jgi:hypothetical protein